MLHNNEEFLWVEKYRPNNLNDIILPEYIRTTFRDFLKKGEIPNMLLAGGAGMGKTTIAKALCQELDTDYIVINGSLDGGIDTLRNDIKSFASTMGFQNKTKVVILDEADSLPAASTQRALRNFMEEYSKNCRFIFTCNYKNRIIEPLHSRTTVIDFIIDKEDKPKIAMAFFKRVTEILKNEKIEFDPKCVAKVIEKHFPDFRRTLNELQKYSSSGMIDEGILANVKNTNIDVLVDSLKEKNFNKMRQWVADNSDCDVQIIYNMIFNDVLNKVKQPPQLIVILADYMNKSAFSANQEITLTACCTEIMASCDFE